MNDEATTRMFHLGDVLSIVGEKLVSPRLIDGVYDICNFMTGDNLFTHRLLRAHKVLRPILLRQHPELAAVDESGVTKENWRAWLDEQIAKHGELVEVAPCAPGEWSYIDPIIEARSLTDAPVIALNV